MESKVTMPSARAGKHSVAKTEKKYQNVSFHYFTLFIIIKLTLRQIESPTTKIGTKMGKILEIQPASTVSNFF